jgi:hypothetical protein
LLRKSFLFFLTTEDAYIYTYSEKTERGGENMYVLMFIYKGLDMNETKRKKKGDKLRKECTEGTI